jgi:tetratricopeptide (TPR) repeat protein
MCKFWAKEYINNWILSILLLTLSIVSFAQKNEVSVFGKLQDDTTRLKLFNVNIAVFQDGQTFEDFSSGLGGKYDLKLPMGHVYEIKFSHPEYASKIIWIDTRNIPEEERRNEFKVEAHGELFKIPPGFNLDLLRDAMTKMAFNGSSKLIAPDENYAEKRKIIIESELERLRAIARDPLGMEKKFNDLVAKGDSEMGTEAFKEAMNSFDQALKIFPKKEPALSKYNAAKKKVQELEKQAKCDADYEAKLKQGEEFFDQKNWNEAVKAFEAAKALKPKEAYPKEMIYTTQQAMKNYNTRIEYDRFLAKAYNNFKYFQWEAAIGNYEKALKLFPDEDFPKAQIAECLARINDKPAPKPDPVKSDPVKPDPIKSDPIKPDPVNPDPLTQDPLSNTDPLLPPGNELLVDTLDSKPLDSLPTLPTEIIEPVDTIPDSPLVELDIPDDSTETSLLDGATAGTDDDPMAKIYILYNGNKQAPVKKPHLTDELLARYAAIKQQFKDDDEFHRNKRDRYKRYSGSKDLKTGPASRPIRKRSYPQASKPVLKPAANKELVDTKTWKQGNKEITQLTYKAAEKTHVYMKVIQIGGNYYSKDHRAITPEMWESETGTSRY